MNVLQAGSIINEYTIVKLLGYGQLGITYLAQSQIVDKSTGKPTVKYFTLKTFDLGKTAQLGLSPSTLEHEATVLQKISKNPSCSKYITRYYNHFTQTISGELDNPSQYLIIVTDYIKGPSLQQLLIEQKGKFELSKLLQMMVDLTQSIDYIHNYGVAHQNIKPSNIIYDSATKRLRLIDFSFSCSQTLHTQCRGKAGTAYYMPPELLDLKNDPSEQDFSLRAAHDIWSAGVVFYQMANLGSDFMNFNNNDPDYITKVIQTSAVNPSTYPYTPINSVITTLLEKNPSNRPTAGQVLILLRLARPLCVINDRQYDRGTAELLAVSMGLDVDADTDDYTLCSILTDNINSCKLRNNDYNKEDLQKLAQIVGIDSNTSSSQLCSSIQKGLETQQEQYSEYVTQELLKALEYMAVIQIRNETDMTLEIQGIFDKLHQKYTFVYTEAKKLDLIDLKLLESKREDVTQKCIVYAKNASLMYARVYGLLSQHIVNVIVSINPNAQINNIPLFTFQQQMLKDVMA